GGLSDRTVTRFGHRLPFLMGAAPVAALALCLVPFAPSLPLMAAGVLAFYLGYFTYYAPYRALHPDLLPAEAGGRAQAILGVFGAAGIGAALVGGGLLLELWQPLPFLVAAACLLLGTAAVVLGLCPGRAVGKAARGGEVCSAPAAVWALLA